MNTKPLERFAQQARRDLMAQVGARLDYVLQTDSAELRDRAAAIAELRAQIHAHGRAAVIDRAAYTWFNRFCALRFMDANDTHAPRVVSPAAGATQPEILAEAKAGHIDPALPNDRQKVLDLLAGRAPSRDGQGEAYRLLLVAACNRAHREMPFLFERIADWTELLLPDDLLSAASVPSAARATLTEEVCADVEVIGWLYQFYISEKKDAVIGSKQKIAAEDIPAATQLFTPHWIVRYLVENSLGRLWLLNRPHSRLAERMDYYIAPSDSDSSSLVTQHSSLVTSPEELRLCDPACGSGHMLTYAFDLLYAIYEEEGYNPPDIPRLILSHNLTGLEIDERAADLAAFALMMKARAKDRRFFGRGAQPHIVVIRPPGIDRDDLQGAGWFRELGRTLLDRPLQEGLLNDLHFLEQADNLGSLIRPQLTAEQIEELRGRITAGGDLLSHTLNTQVLDALDQLEALARRYHVVVANPPYMGNMNDDLKKFVNAVYPDSKSDLFAVFIERCLALAREGGLVGMITMQSWMFLSSYENLRAKLLDEETILSMAHLGARAFDTIGGEVVSTTAFILERTYRPEHPGVFLRLIDGRSEAEKSAAALEAIRNPECGWFYRASAADFKKIPGAPIAYWVSEVVREAFAEGQPLGSIASPRAGLATGDNETYQRMWSEVSHASIAFDCLSNEESKLRHEKWYPCHSGGSFRKWYGNHETVVNWRFDGEELRQFRDASGKLRSRPQNTQFYFKPGITWTKLSSTYFAARLREVGFVFDDTGRSAFPGKPREIEPLLAMLCSKVAASALSILNPSMSFTSGDVANVPVLTGALSQLPEQLVSDSIRVSREDWDAYEISWDFSTLPLLRPEHRRETMAATYAALREHWRAMTLEMQRLEEANNRIFIDAYGLGDELTPDVPLREITLTCNPFYRYGVGEETAEERPQTTDDGRRTGDDGRWMGGIAPPAAEARLRADTMREFISYAVGCMFGRYSLVKPGLVLADAGSTVEDYEREIRNYELGIWNEEAGGEGQVAGEEASSDDRSRHSSFVTRHSYLVTPDRDGVLPILDGDWFADDVVGEFKRFLRATFGDEHFEENLAFIEAALGRDIRSYFLREFYDHHVKTYKKRPIYWLFSSPGGSFNALIYLHRYRPDTVSVVLNNYLRDFRSKLEAHRENLRRLSVSEAAGPREKTQALRELDKLEKTLAELRAYESEVLYPLATRRVELDLDDGVKVNYNKLGRALKRVTGLSE